MAIYAIIAVVIIVVAGLGAAYGLGYIGKKSSSPPGSCGTGQTVIGAGANFIFPLVSAWEVGYASASGNKVSYSPVGAGTGITDITDKTVDFAATDDPLNASEVANLGGDTVLTLPISGGAETIVYNLPGLTAPISLNGSVLAQIYLGDITTWNSAPIAALNPSVSLPSNAIQTVHRSDASGATFVFTNFLSDESSAWKSGPGAGIQIAWPNPSTPYVAKSSNSQLAAYVLATPYSIGYSDLSDTLNDPGLQFAKVQNPSGKFVLPTVADTTSAIQDIVANTTFPANSASWDSVTMLNAPAPGDYPLATLSYFFVYQALDKGYEPSEAKAKVIWQFLNWTIGPGQLDNTALYYAPLPPALVSLDQTGLKTLTYGGSALPSCH